MAEVPPLGAIFGQPFAFQLAAFRRRLGELRATTNWRDVDPTFHDRGFMVAGAMKADLLADLAQAVDRAQQGQATLEDFRRDFRAAVAKHGWHGWTGEETARGQAWRTRVIYKTNIATAYAAGRRAQLLAGNFKYWVYRHGGSREPRPIHLSWDGVALPPDHPFWATHSPPNGWGCSCYVVGARSAAGVRRLGGDPDRGAPEDWQDIDARTGTPVGIDKGWDYAPGATVSTTVQHLSRRLEILPDQLSIDLIQSWLRMDSFGDWLQQPSGNWPLARLPAPDAALLGSSQRVVVLSAETMAKQDRHHPELLALDYLMAQHVIDQATRRIHDTGRSLIYVHESPAAGGWVLVVKATQERDDLYAMSLRRLSADPGVRRRILQRLANKER